MRIFCNGSVVGVTRYRAMGNELPFVHAKCTVVSVRRLATREVGGLYVARSTNCVEGYAHADGNNVPLRSNVRARNQMRELIGRFLTSTVLLWKIV